MTSGTRFKISSQLARDSVRSQQNSFCTALTLHDFQISVCPLNSPYFRDVAISDPEHTSSTEEPTRHRR